jgi:hypothetical protein
MVFYTNNTDRHDIIELLLKVELNTINPTSTLIDVYDNKVYVYFCKYILYMKNIDIQFSVHDEIPE